MALTSTTDSVIAIQGATGKTTCAFRIVLVGNMWLATTTQLEIASVFNPSATSIIHVN